MALPRINLFGTKNVGSIRIDPLFLSGIVCEPRIDGSKYPGPEGPALGQP
jgi:hypothetical protein